MFKLMGKKIIECYANKISLSGPMSQSQTITKHGPNTKTCKFGQEIVQSYTTDQNTAPQGRGTELRQPRDSKNNHVRNYNKHWTNNSAVGNVSGNRCESGCISRDREFDPGPVPYFRGNFIMNSFLRSLSSLPLNHSRKIVVSYKRKYVHEVLVNSLFKLAQEKSVVRWTNCPAMATAVDFGRKAAKQTQ